MFAKCLPYGRYCAGDRVKIKTCLLASGMWWEECALKEQF